MRWGEVVSFKSVSDALPLADKRTDRRVKNLIFRNVVL